MYDPMVAKLIVWDVDREHATRRMLRALDEYEVGGLTTLIPFHKALLATEQWASGETCRDLMEDREWLKTTAPADAAAPADDRGRRRAGHPRLQGRGLRQALRRQGDRRGRSPAAAAPAAGGKKPPKRERKAGGGGGASSESLPSPLQGTVFKVAVEQGAEVAEGDLICVIEAMKMENEIVAHRAGKVDDAERRRGRRGLQRRRPRRDRVAAPRRARASTPGALRLLVPASLAAVPPFLSSASAFRAVPAFICADHLLGVRVRVSGISDGFFAGSRGRRSPRAVRSVRGGGSCGSGSSWGCGRCC